MKKKTVPHYASLHGIRGFMALAILVFHFGPFAFEKGQAIPFVMENLAHAVDVFFVLSGFVLSYAYSKNLPFGPDSFKRYFYHRIARIVPLAWLAVCVFFFMYKMIALTGAQMNHPLDTSLRNFIGNLLFLDSNLPGFYSIPAKWSVSNEMLAYVALFPLSYLLAGGKRKMLIIFLGIVIVQIFLWNELSRLGLFFSRCAPSFLAGCIIYHLKPEVKGNVPNVVLFSVGMLGLVFLENRFQVVFSSMIVIAGISNAGVVHGIFSSRPMIFFGDISYSLYLLHCIYTLILAGFFRLYPELRPSYLFWVWIPVGLSILTGYLSYRFWENPMRKWLRNVGDKKLLGVSRGN